MNPSPPSSVDREKSIPSRQGSQVPGFREKLCQVLKERGYSAERVGRYVAWCQDFILYHHRRPPMEMGALEVEQYFQHLCQERGGAVGEARDALAALYRDVMGQGQALAPRLLDRVRAVQRVRHYA